MDFHNQLITTLKKISDTRLISLLTDLHDYHFNTEWGCCVKKGSNLDTFYAPFRNKDMWFDTVEKAIMREAHMRYGKVTKLMMIDRPMNYIKVD